MTHCSVNRGSWYVGSFLDNLYSFLCTVICTKDEILRHISICVEFIALNSHCAIGVKLMNDKTWKYWFLSFVIHFGKL